MSHISNPTGKGGFTKGQCANPRGRPKGARGKLYELTEKQRTEMAERHGIMPLDFFMSTMRDESARIGDRLEAAKLAAPYLHRKMPIAVEGGDSDAPIGSRADLSALSKAEKL